MAIFKGAGVALVTPFNKDGSANYDMLEKLLDFQIENGTDAIIICGTSGEAPTLKLDEHYELIRHTVKYVNHRIPVIAGSGSNDTDTAIGTSHQAELAGADGLLCVTPYYNKCMQRGLIENYTAIAKSTDLPIILYNVPGRTGVNIQPATAAKLINTVDNIVGIKEASGNISQCIKVTELTQGDADLYSGNDDQIVPVLSCGGIGVISVLSNVAPRQTHDIVQNWLDGDIKAALAGQVKALDLVDQLFCEVNPIPVKKAMQLMGYEVGNPRLPLTEMEPDHAENLRRAMEAYGIPLV